MNTHIVKRTFPHTSPITVGDEVDASQWRNARLLEKQGYIELIQTEKSEIEPVLNKDELPAVEPITEEPVAPAPDEIQISEPQELEPAAEIEEAPEAIPPAAPKRASKTPAKSTKKAAKSTKKAGK